MENEKMMEQLLARARVALAELEGCTQTQIDAYCKAACLAFRDHAEELAKEAVEETGMGNVPDKIIKNTGAPEGVWYAIKGKKSVGVIGHDEAKGLSFVARPKGNPGLCDPHYKPKHHHPVQWNLWSEGPQCDAGGASSPGKKDLLSYLPDHQRGPGKGRRAQEHLPVHA